MDTPAREMEVDQLLVTDRYAHHRVLVLRELLQFKLRGGDRMVLPHQAHVAVHEQRLLEEIPLAQDSNNVGNTVTQEIRFSKPASPDSRWSWVGGFYFSKARLYTSYDLFTPTNQTTEQLYGISSYQYFGIPDQPDNRVGTYRLYVTNTEEAAYGNLNFNVTDQLRLTGGVRFSNITQDFWQTNYGQESSDTATSPIATVEGSRHNRPVAPLGGVQYNFTPDAMLYLTGAKGFRAGGINEPLNAFACAAPLQFYGLTVNDIPKTYGPDTVWSYELGTKMGLLDRRLQVNLSAFWINWTNIQSSIPTPPGCNTGWTENGGKAISRGLDLQVQYQPVDAIGFDLRAEYDDAYYATAVNGPTPLNGSPPTTVIEKGQKFVVPTFTGDFGIQYNFNALDHKNYIRRLSPARAPSATAAAWFPVDRNAPSSRCTRHSSPRSCQRRVSWVLSSTTTSSNRPLHRGRRRVRRPNPEPFSHALSPGVLRENVVSLCHDGVAPEPTLGVVCLRRLVRRRGWPEGAGCVFILERAISPATTVGEPLAVLHHEVNVMERVGDQGRTGRRYIRLRIPVNLGHLGAVRKRLAVFRNTGFESRDHRGIPEDHRELAPVVTDGNGLPGLVPLELGKRQAARYSEGVPILGGHRSADSQGGQHCCKAQFDYAAFACHSRYPFVRLGGRN
jgi:TonB dependent receptor